MKSGSSELSKLLGRKIVFARDWQLYGEPELLQTVSTDIATARNWLLKKSINVMNCAQCEHKRTIVAGQDGHCYMFKFQPSGLFCAQFAPHPTIKMRIDMLRKAGLYAIAPSSTCTLVSDTNVVEHKVGWLCDSLDKQQHIDYLVNEYYKMANLLRIAQDDLAIVTNTDDLNHPKNQHREDVSEYVIALHRLKAELRQLDPQNDINQLLELSSLRKS